MDDMDTGSISGSGSDNRELSEDEIPLSPSIMVSPIITFDPNYPLSNEKSLFRRF